MKETKTTKTNNKKGAGNNMREVTNIMDLRVTFIKKRVREQNKELLRDSIEKKIKEYVDADDVAIKNFKTFIHEEKKEITYILDMRVTYIKNVDDPNVCEGENNEEIKRAIAKKFKKIIGADDVIVKNRKVFIMDEK